LPDTATVVMVTMTNDEAENENTDEITHSNTTRGARTS